jgi:hypothetical protein
MTLHYGETPKQRAVRALNRLQEAMDWLKEADRNVAANGLGFEELLRAQQAFDRARVDYFQASRAAYSNDQSPWP